MHICIIYHMGLFSVVYTNFPGGENGWLRGLSVNPCQFGGFEPFF